MAVGVTLLSKTVAKANRIEQKRLDLSETEEVIRVTRLRSYDAGTRAYERVVLPVGRLRGITVQGDLASDIATLAGEYGIVLGKASERVGVVTASKTIARWLEVEPGARVLRLDRVVLTADGKPLEWRVTHSVLGVASRSGCPPAAPHRWER